MIHRWCGCDKSSFIFTIEVFAGGCVVAPRFFYLLNHCVSYSVTIFSYEGHGM